MTSNERLLSEEQQDWQKDYHRDPCGSPAATNACARRTGRATTSEMVEIVAPFGGAEEMMKDLQEKVFNA